MRIAAYASLAVVAVIVLIVNATDGPWRVVASCEHTGAVVACSLTEQMLLGEKRVRTLSGPELRLQGERRGRAGHDYVLHLGGASVAFGWDFFGAYARDAAADIARVNERQGVRVALRSPNGLLSRGGAAIFIVVPLMAAAVAWMLRRRRR